MSGKEKSQFSDEVMSAVESDELKMKPRAYFMLTGAVAGLATVTSGALLALFVSQIAKDYSVGEDLGALGLRSNAEPNTYPLTLLATSAVLLVLTLLLVKRLEFSYKYRMYTVFAIVGGAVGIMTILISLSGVDEQIYGRGPLKAITPTAKVLQHNRLFGEVLKHKDDYFVVQTPIGDLVKVKVNANTDYYQEDEIVPGIEIGIAGLKLNDEEFEAHIIRRDPPIERIYKHLRARVKGLRSDRLEKEPHVEEEAKDLESDRFERNFHRPL